MSEVNGVEKLLVNGVETTPAAKIKNETGKNVTRLIRDHSAKVTAMKPEGSGQ